MSAGRKPTPVITRLLGMSERQPNGCLLWSGELTPTGYGRIKVDGRLEYVHRVAWSLKYGEIPEGMTVKHFCHVRHCVNPNHTYVGLTQSAHLKQHA